MDSIDGLLAAIHPSIKVVIKAVGRAEAIHQGLRRSLFESKA